MPQSELGSRWSPYSYAFDNPVRFIDPDGMWASSVTKTDAMNAMDEMFAAIDKKKEDGKDSGGGDKGNGDKNGEKENCCPNGGDKLTSNELDNQKYPVSVNLNDNPDKLFDDIISMYDWLFVGPFIRQPNDGRKKNFFNINDFVTNIPDKGDGLSGIVSRTLETSYGVKFTWAIQPYNVDRSENYNKGYVSSIQSNNGIDRGQIHLIGGPTNKNAVFTFTIFDKGNYEPIFRKIYKGYYR